MNKKYINSGNENSKVNISFDKEIAKIVQEDFVYACDVPCELFLPDGTSLNLIDNSHTTCKFCETFHESKGLELPCKHLHVYGAFEAERLGGRYIYTCPADLFFISSPIMISGVLSGFMTAGPIGMPDTDEILDSQVFKNTKLSKLELSNIEKALKSIKCADTATVKAISGQLFTTCLYISDSMHEMYLAKSNVEKDSLISDVLVSLEPEGEKKHYPSNSEFELFNAISKKDFKKSGELINEILGYIFFYYKSSDEVKTRVSQLFTVISRAAILGGANSDYILNACDNFLMDLQPKTDITSILRWAAAHTSRFINLIFDFIGYGRTSPISYAINYIGEHCTEKITLEEISAEVGYSTTYFSKVFKDETGENFKTYLIRMRIEKSKILLLTTSLPMSDICIQSGFSDQSYFCKLFKQLEGVTPNKFRNRTRRLDVSKEKSKD